MKAVALLSGGMDSTAALAYAASVDTLVAAVSVDYGQKHARELKSAAMIAEFYHVPHIILDFRSWGAQLGSVLTKPGEDVPHGHYAHESMKATVVPNRNAVLLMAAVGIAQTLGADNVYTGVHAGDHPIYPDCRPEFIAAANEAAGVATEWSVGIVAPFVHSTKTDIVRRGRELGVPFELTWSCYEGGDVHCGACGTCYERREAFADAGAVDPTRYAALPMYESGR